MFTQQVEELSLSIEDIVEAGQIQEELLNRMGMLLQVGSPTVDELAIAMRRVEMECGVSVPETERDGLAKQCVLSMQGFRGLENYAARCAMHAVLLQAKAKRQPSPPEVDPNNPRWF